MSATTTTIERRDYPMLIGGQSVTTKIVRTVHLSYDDTAVGEVYDADEDVLEQAIAAAQAGAAAMASLTQYERSELLDHIRRLLERDAAEFSLLVSSETGKPIREARVEVERAQQTLRASADEARRLHGEVVPMEAAPIGKGRMALTVLEPLGVIGAITPFNVPLNLALHKVGPALAAGNSVVHKPATNTPLSALRLARLIQEAGAPAGAYNVVTGQGSLVGERLVRDERIAMITFTGSVPVGKQIKAGAGLRRVTIELGANCSVILEPDSDLEALVPRCVAGAFSHSGQVCISVQNIFVHERIAEEFIGRFVVEPAILTSVPLDSRICWQEVFGPVVALHRYRGLEEAIAAVNAGEYGLQAGLCTRDIEKAFYAARQIKVGGVILNDVPMYRADHMPYGGVKNSGVGREGPRYAIEEMTEMKLICWKA